MKRFWGCGCLCFALLALAFLLAPIPFAGHQVKARVTGCLSNRKQIGTALMMYIQDYDERFPHQPDLWTTQLDPYVKNDELYRCPSLNKSEYGMAFDSRLAGKSWATLFEPEKTSAIFESQNRAKNANSPGIGFSTRHNGFGNVAFADGHAKALNREAFDALSAPRWKESKAGEAKKVAEDAKR